MMCQTNLGALDKSFLCKSVGVLNCGTPALISEEHGTVAEALSILKAKKLGCLGVVDSKGAIKGIFSERDFILKVADDYQKRAQDSIALYMTKNPVTQAPDTTIAFALNLMSQGGFRNLPIVDADGVPLFIISVKDVIDFMVESMTAALLDFPVGE